MKYKTILLFGAPGAGKGTQGKILGTIPHFYHCACGDVFRSLSAANPLARVFIEYTSPPNDGKWEWPTNFNVVKFDIKDTYRFKTLPTLPGTVPAT